MPLSPLQLLRDVRDTHPEQRSSIPSGFFSAQTGADQTGGILCEHRSERLIYLPAAAEESGMK
jgi:hypothetical protein